MHTFRTVGNVETIGNAQTRMGVNLPPGELVGANIKPAPTLRVSDKPGDRHWSLDHRGQRVADPDRFPKARLGTPYGFVMIMPVSIGKLRLGIFLYWFRFQIRI